MLSNEFSIFIYFNFMKNNIKKKLTICNNLSSS